jgi:glycosyltransferase involved in cell wall biosynthesis
MSPPLTLLQLTHQGEGAGSTQSILSLSQHLERRGHRVVVGCRPGTLLARRAVETGLEHAPLEFDRLGPLSDALADLIARERVDVVNSHATRDRRALTWLRWRGRLPQPFVVTRRTMPRTSPIELIAVGLTADRTIAVSGAVARALRRRLHPAGRMRVVPNGIDLARVDAEPAPADVAAARRALGQLDGRPLVVVAARRKDQDVLLRALPAIRRPVAVVLVGIEPDPELAALRDALPGRHRVTFVPFTERPLAFVRLATAVALPSRIEGLSQALLEAMALGLPVIASHAGGNPDLVTSGETGVLVPPLDPTAWAQALDRVLSDAALRDRIARAGRALVRREFTLERTAERTEAVYLEALQRTR